MFVHSRRLLCMARRSFANIVSFAAAAGTTLHNVNTQHFSRDVAPRTPDTATTACAL
jgi:hypothetical protein